MTTIGSFFETARRHPAKLAWKHGRREWTWAEAARDVRRTRASARSCAPAACVPSPNGQLASYETIKRFRVLRAQFSIASGELTPTLKLKRKVVSQKYAREIEELFGIA